MFCQWFVCGGQHELGRYPDYSGQGCGGLRAGLLSLLQLIMIIHMLSILYIYIPSSSLSRSPLILLLPMYQVLDMLGTETSVQELRETVGALQKAGVSGGWVRGAYFKMKLQF